MSHFLRFGQCHWTNTRNVGIPENVFVFGQLGYRFEMKLPLSAAAIFIVLFGSALSYSQPQSVSKPSPEQLLLKDYRPTSIFNIPSNYVHKARYGAIDAHSHNYGGSAEQVERWVRTMDDVGIEKTIVLSGATGAALDATVARYRKFPGRFEVWCGIDYTGFDKPGYGPAAIAELERCRKAGATGVGELSDKGRGLGGTTNRAGMHIDDPRMAPILEKCAELGMPINIHVGEDRWMYEPMDSSNDGLMNAWIWKIPQDSAVLQHDEVVNTLARALRKHPRTTFVACHLANCCSDLSQVARMLDACTNLFVDIGARFSEIAPSPEPPRSSSRITRTACFTAQTWSLTRACTARRSEYSRLRMSTSISRISASIIGRCMPWLCRTTF